MSGCKQTRSKVKFSSVFTAAGHIMTIVLWSKHFSMFHLKKPSHPNKKLRKLAWVFFNIYEYLPLQFGTQGC